MSKKENKTKFTNYIFNKKRLIIFLLIVLSISIVIESFKKPIEMLLNYGTLNYSEVFTEDGAIIHFIDVGQGDAICIELPDDKICLIDCGNIDKKSRTKYANFLEDNIFKNREKVVDYFILTHADSDHCGSMKYLFENYEIKNFYRPKQYLSSEFEGYNDLQYITDYDKNNLVDVESSYFYAEGILEASKEDYCNIKYNEKGIEINGLLANYSFKFLSPNLDSYVQGNNFSPVILFTYKGKNVLFTGDAENIVEEEILKEIKGETIDILKVAHHGSNSSTSENLLESINLKNAVISCGRDNSYGHPSSLVVTRLKYISKIKDENIHRTDLVGNISANISFNGNLNFMSQMQKLKFYVYSEYLILFISVILAFFSFYDYNKNN